MQDGLTALIPAAYGGYFEIVKYLEEKGADKEAKKGVRSLPCSMLDVLVVGLCVFALGVYVVRACVRLSGYNGVACSFVFCIFIYVCVHVTLCI